MDDVRPTIDGFDRQQEQASTGFTKTRFTDGDTVIDVALMSVPPDEHKAMIARRKEELQTMTLRVPSPYTGEIEAHEQDDDNPITFKEIYGRTVGSGYADPEYRPLTREMHRIPRYRYVVTWQYFTEFSLLAEIEVFLPPDQSVNRGVSLADEVAVASKI